jgi:membrane protease YdiL (CAAX protease family)
LQPSAPQTVYPEPVAPRSLHFALFITGSLWVLAAMTISARAAAGITDHYNLTAGEGLLEELFFLFLLLVGFGVLQNMTRRPSTVRSTNALPKRPTTPQEFLRGLALGWAMLLVAVVPMMLIGALHLTFWLQPRVWGLELISIATLAVAALALEVAFRGYLLMRLSTAVGPSIAVSVLAFGYALIASFRDGSTGLSVVITFLFAILFSIAYLRTHALWIGWGIHFGWMASTAILFGLPIAGSTANNQLITTTLTGPDWLTGGYYGPEAALFTFVIVVAAIPVLYRITRDYAWEFTHPPIIPAGYAVTIAPPAAHTAMEAAAPPPAPLVQIIGATPVNASTLPIIEEHLREEAKRREAEAPPEL